jgi:hypothetical protein
MFTFHHQYCANAPGIHHLQGFQHGGSGGHGVHKSALGLQDFA